MNGTQPNNVTTTMLKAADWLTENELNQGYYGFGLAKGDKPTKKPHAIDVCPPDKVQQLDSCDVMGAVLWAAGAEDLGDETTLAAMRRCRKALDKRGVDQSPCAWSDKPGRTKHEVAELLRQAATMED